jgi:hypothetical protein
MATPTCDVNLVNVITTPGRLHVKFRCHYVFQKYKPNGHFLHGTLDNTAHVRIHLSVS